MCLKFTLLKLLPYPPGADMLNTYSQHVNINFKWKTQQKKII